MKSINSKKAKTLICAIIILVISITTVWTPSSAYAKDILPKNTPVQPKPIYNVFFNANGGSVSVASKLVQYSNIYGSLPKPTRKKYVFRGWYTAPKGGKEITQYSKFYGNSDSTLYARWQTLKAYEKEVMKHINAERKKRKLVKLKWDKKLTKGTKTRAKEITKKFSHTRPNGGSGAKYLLKFVKKGRSSGECLGMGFDDPKKLVKAFMDSPSHKRIIMMKKGRSVAVSSKVYNGTTYWCVGTSAIYKNSK